MAKYSIKLVEKEEILGKLYYTLNVYKSVLFGLVPIPVFTASSVFFDVAYDNCVTYIKSVDPNYLEYIV